jgi:nucleoside-diphosphate-sugar epimerase
MLTFWEIPDGSETANRITALRGDVTLPRFGLDDDTYRRVASGTTHIVHSAAIVKMNLPLEEARHSAVSSVKAILELAEQCRSNGNLQKVDIVSTVGVSGLTPGLMPEEPMLHVEKFHNTYEASKSEAERYIFANQGQLPVTIHRPSMVVGHSQTGKIIHFQVFYHLCEFLSGRHTHGVIPQIKGVSLDTIPVDYVAMAIVYSALNPEKTKGRIFHLCSGPDSAMPIGELASRVSQAMGGKSPFTIPYGVFRHGLGIMARFSGERNRKALRNLPIFLNYLELPQQFSNQVSKPFFEGAGIQNLSPYAYLPTVLGYYLKSR